MDGYPEGHGKELAEFLKDLYMVNGLGMNETRKVANGMGCLTAQVIAHFKTESGGIYIHPAKSRNCWEDYIYTITANGKQKPIIKCEHVGDKRAKTLFNGTAEEFLDWLKTRKKGE